MEHIAIDVGSRESQICVRNERGEILEERRYVTANLSRFLAKKAPGARVLVPGATEHAGGAAGLPGAASGHDRGPERAHQGGGPALEQLAEQDPVCKLFQTMPGVGPVTAVCFATAIDDVQRFEGAHKVTSYLGLTPGENTTGFKTKRTGMTKAGSSRVRWSLNQAAWTMVRSRPNDPLVQWFQQVAGRRGKKIAITALARKMASILYAMWRDQKPYNPAKAVQEQQP